MQAIKGLDFFHLRHKRSGQELEEENVYVLSEMKANGR